jgi:chorismate mutase
MNTQPTWAESPIHEQIRNMHDTLTPETDKHEFPCMTWPSQDHPMVVRAAFARKLERELTAVTKQRDDLQMQLDSSCNAEELRQFRDELTAVTEQRDKTREESAMWKAYHDNQVALKSMLIERPDLGDRASRIAELISERGRLAEEVGQLKSRLTQTMGAVTISRNGYLQELEQQRDRLAEALDKVVDAWDHAEWLDENDFESFRAALQSLTPKP